MKRLFYCSCYSKKDPTASIRKHTNELKVHEKTVRIVFKWDLNSLDYAIWGILENKTNPTTHLNIGSLKTAIEQEWNKMFEEFILKTCKSFQRHVDTMKAILSKFTILYLSLLFFKLILFYNRVVYYYTRKFLILLLHPVHTHTHTHIHYMYKSLWRRV